MSVYRGDKPKDKNPAQPPSSPASPPAPQPRVRQPDSELIGLNRHRQRHGHDPLDDPETADDEQPEVDDQIIDDNQPGELYSSPQGRGGRRGLGQKAIRLAKSNAGKKVALAASGFLAPVLIAVVLLVLAMEAGLQTEQVARVITGVRFSRLYGQMSKRLGHIKETHTLWAIDPDGKNTTLQELNKRRPIRSSLVGRLTGTNDKKIHRDLRTRGYSFEFADKGIPGRERAVGLLDQKGNRVLDFSKDKPQSSVRQLRDFKVQVRGEPGYGDGLWGRFKARRTTRVIAYQAGIKLKRFRGAMDNIRRTRDWASNKIRGPPPAGLMSTSQAVSNDIITQKNGVRRRVFANGFRLGGLINISDNDIESAGRQWAKETRKGWGNRTRNWVDEKGKRLERTKVAQNLKSSNKLAKVAGFAKGASALVLMATSFCTIYELVDMISNLAKLKIAQQMDTAAGLFTVTSQMRAGDMEHALSNNLNGRLDGFANTASYQVLHDGATSPTKAHVASTVAYINRHFNIKKSFGSMFAVMQTFISNFTRYLKHAISNTAPVKLYSWGAGFLNFLFSFIPGVSDPIPDVDGIFDWFLNTGCEQLLKPITQIVIGSVFFLLETTISFFTGGLWTAITVGLRAFMQTILLAVAVEGVVRATNLDEVAFNYLMPEAVAIASGVDSALAEAPDIERLLSDESGSGPENYLKLDYGAWHLGQSQALAEGGGLIDRDTAVAQDKIYLAQHKRSYTQQGVWNNIANPRNPYSMMAKLRAWLPSNPLESQPTQIRSAGSWLATTPTGLIGSAQADEELDKIRGLLLYPDQGRSVDFIQEGEETTSYEITDTETSNDKIVGFAESEVNGEGEFDFVANSFYVEDNLDRLKDRYSQCLAVSLPEFRLHQAGIKKTDGGPFYPSECLEPDARRYLIYYQDCLHLNDLERIDSNSSPMMASDCDDLLPDGLAEDLENAGSELESISGGSVSQITRQLLTSQASIDEPTPLEGSTFGWPVLASTPQNPVGARLWSIT